MSEILQCGREAGKSLGGDSNYSRHELFYAESLSNIALHPTAAGGIVSGRG